jgi:paraquat-inducible protein B
MSEQLDSADVASLPSAILHRSQRSRLTLVWLAPVLAALIGGWIAARAVIDRGPTITVTFVDADGIEAGKTRVRYKNVDVGNVKLITLAPDLRTVNVTIEMAKFAQRLVVSDTRFWVVRPRLGASGVSGLGTILSGAYIGMDVGASRETAREFTGLETPPVVEGGTAGKQFVLESQDLGSLGVGAPAYFHHIQVGQISSISLNPDGHGVTLKLFVTAPYDRFVTDDTRFWHASGVDIAVDSGGVRMQTESLTAILAGGVALETPPGSMVTAPASADSRFHLATNRDAAMKAPDRVVDQYILNFDESLRGLAPGAIVNFRGVDIGEVASLNVEYDRGQGKFRFPVLINVFPERIRSRYREGSDRPQVGAHVLVADMIEHGFRAQLRTASLLTGQLYIALDFFPRSPRMAPRPELTPMPLPTIPGNLEELQDAIVSVAHKLDQMPLAKIGQDADDALRSLSQALSSANGLLGKVQSDILPGAKSTLTQAELTLAQAQQAVAPETSLQNDLHTTLTSVSRAADSIRVLADYLDKHPEALLRGKTEERH